MVEFRRWHPHLERGSWKSGAMAHARIADDEAIDWGHAQGDSQGDSGSARLQALSPPSPSVETFPPSQECHQHRRHGLPGHLVVPKPRHLSSSHHELSEEQAEGGMSLRQLLHNPATSRASYAPLTEYRMISALLSLCNRPICFVPSSPGRLSCLVRNPAGRRELDRRET